MARIIGFSEGANLGVHALAYLADLPEQEPVPAARIAEALGFSAHHLTKVLKRLAQAGLVRAQRGPSGGFSLKRNPTQVMLLEIIEAVDGPLEESHCLQETPSCGSICTLGKGVRDVFQQMAGLLAKTPVSALPSAIVDQES